LVDIKIRDLSFFIQTLFDMSKYIPPKPKNLEELERLRKENEESKQKIEAAQPRSELLEKTVSHYEVEPEIFENPTKEGLEKYGNILFELANDTKDGLVDLKELIEYERKKGKDPRVYLPLIETANYALHLQNFDEEGNLLGPKIPLLPFEEHICREWVKVEKIGNVFDPYNPLNKAWSVFIPAYEEEDGEKP